MNRTGADPHQRERRLCGGDWTQDAIKDEAGECRLMFQVADNKTSYLPAGNAGYADTLRNLEKIMGISGGLLCRYLRKFTA
jgi:hypothetical protein